MKKGLFIVAMLMVFICGCAIITKIYSNGGIISATPAMVIDGTEVVYSNGGYIPVEAATRK